MNRLLKPLISKRLFTTSRFTMGDIIKRNPHPDFKGVEASRPELDTASEFRYTKTVDADWAFGSGANRLAKDDADKKHIAIDPHEEGRPAGFNYKLMISSIVPRPIAFVSSQAPDGTHKNLAPFSYFNMMNHDPPMFVVGFSSSLAAAKDSLRNVSDSGECVINIISEHFIEAANSCSVDAPYGVSEWDISGLTPSYDCETVKCARVREAIVSIECKLDMLKEFDSKARPGNKSGTMAVFEGTRFWVREDALNEEKNLVDPGVLKPVSRLGGITYARVTEAFELPRTEFKKDVGGEAGLEEIQKKQNK
jgi:flavin reductase (DIM6/NTAB) family NADH-FMN oxidoreductase RutF